MIPITLTYEDVVNLYDAHAGKQIPFIGPHYDLLREHAADFVIVFAKMIRRQGIRYRLRFTSLQARSFMQLWLNEPLPPHAALLINQVLAHLDKQNKQVRPLTTKLLPV